MLDQDSGVVLATYPFDELEGEPAESVAMGDHNFFDPSSHDFVHQP
jgi:hypothetical protein